MNAEPHPFIPTPSESLNPGPQGLAHPLLKVGHSEASSLDKATKGHQPACLPGPPGAPVSQGPYLGGVARWVICTRKTHLSSTCERLREGPMVWESVILIVFINQSWA